MCSKFSQSGLFTLELPTLIAEKTIFDLLGMLDLGERSLLFGRFILPLPIIVRKPLIIISQIAIAGFCYFILYFSRRMRVPY